MLKVFDKNSFFPENLKKKLFLQQVFRYALKCDLVNCGFFSVAHYSKISYRMIANMTCRRPVNVVTWSNVLERYWRVFIGNEA